MEKKSFINTIKVLIGIQLLMVTMDRSLTTILNDSDLSLLESDELAERGRASVRLSDAMQDIMKIDDSTEMLLIVETEHDTRLDAVHERLSYDRKNEIREFVIEDVASEVGFDNFSYFSTLFKKEYDMTPNEYRKSRFG